jgi:hypothetical protein
VLPAAIAGSRAPAGLEARREAVDIVFAGWSCAVMFCATGQAVICPSIAETDGALIVEGSQRGQAHSGHFTAVSAPNKIRRDRPRRR